MNRPNLWSEEQEILFEDNHLLIINKPAGLLVQGDATGDEPLSAKAEEYLRFKYKKPGAAFVGVAHRLDRPVSGVVALAKTSKALSRLNELFRDNKVHKTYWALVGKVPDPIQGHLTHWLVKDPIRNVTKAYPTRHPQGQKSDLDYEVLGQAGNRWLLAGEPHHGPPPPDSGAAGHRPEHAHRRRREVRLSLAPARRQHCPARPPARAAAPRHEGADVLPGPPARSRALASRPSV